MYLFGNCFGQVLDCLSLAGASWSLWCPTQMEVKCSKQSTITPEREGRGGREGGREGGEERTRQKGGEGRKEKKRMRTKGERERGGRREKEKEGGRE